MKVLDLSEYRSSPAELSRVDVEYLEQQLTGKIAISRPALGAGYLLNPQQYVGVVRLPSGQVLRCNSKVPVANLMRMLAEALNLPELLPEHVELDRIDELLELTARHFVRLVLRRIDAGMFRSYVERADNLTKLRGRIDFAEDMRANYALRHRTFCRFAEFTWDVPENQVIRQVLGLLAAQPVFSRALRNQLRAAEASMDAVSVGRFHANDVDRFRYHRFNQDYEPIHQLCRLFLEGSSLSESLGTFDGRAFLVDMNKLFEGFITRILEVRAPTGVRVRAQAGLHLDEERQIPIRPDIIVEEDGRALVVADCKYKPASADEFKNSDVYQVLAYCTAIECGQGALLYPAPELSGAALTASIRGAHVRIHQLGVDLSLTGAAWQSELDRFAAAVFNDRAETVAA